MRRPDKRARFAFTVFIALACSINLVCPVPTIAQERHWGGHGSSGGFGSAGGFGGPPGGGFSNAFSVVPSVVADVLLVPSLSKAQQAKVRTLYIDYRAKSAGRMDVMNKLRSSSHHRHDSDHRSDSRTKESDPVENDHSRGSAKLGKTDDSGDGKRRHSRGGPEDSMDNASSSLRRTMFMSMLKEYQKFQDSVIGVLSEKQQAELKDIAKKAGSPDYFKVRHYDLMNAD